MRQTNLMAACIHAETEAATREPTQAYYKYVEESDRATTKVYV